MKPFMNLRADLIDYAIGTVLDVNENFTRVELTYNEPDECFAINVPAKCLTNFNIKKGDGIIYKVYMKEGEEEVMLQRAGLEGMISQEEVQRILRELKIAS